MTNKPGPAQKALEYADEDQIVRFTQDFIRINSVNPNLGTSAGEAEAVDFLAEASRKAGLQVKVVEIAPGRPNFYCVLPGDEEEVALAFLGHTDTVPFLGMKDPLSGDIDHNAIWGRGGVDMKGGVAASVQAMIALAKAGVHLRKSLAVWAVMDEESEHRGAFALEQGKFQAGACIVTEPSDMRVMLGCKGTAPIQINLTGVLAHGSNPWLGVNAIEMAAKVVLALTKVVPKKIYIPELDMTIQGSINVGVINGGTQYNNVADACSLFLDRRMAPGETQASVLAEINEILAALAQEDPKFKAQAEISRPDWHWEPIRQRGLNPAYTPATSPVVQAVQTAYRSLVGQDASLSYTHGYMDMDFVANGLSIPTINFGPGETKYAHTIDERLGISDLLTATRVYILSALQLAG